MMDSEADGSKTGMPGRSSPLNSAEAPETAIAASSATIEEEQEGPVGGGGGGDSKVSHAVVMEMGMVPLEDQQQRRGESTVDGADASVPVPEEEKAGSIVVDMTSDGGGRELGGSGGGGNWETEEMCRICHVSPDRREGSNGRVLIQIGCGCKGDLGVAHRHCAESWFKLKGNRCCEICGMGAKNITGIEDMDFVDEWNERRILGSGGNGNSSDRCGCWRGQPFCNFLMACLVIAFILPWFFRVNVF